MAISTNQKPTIYRNLYENTGPGDRNILLGSRLIRKVKIMVNFLIEIRESSVYLALLYIITWEIITIQVHFVAGVEYTAFLTCILDFCQS